MHLNSLPNSIIMRTNFTWYVKSLLFGVCLLATFSTYGQGVNVLTESISQKNAQLVPEQGLSGQLKDGSLEAFFRAQNRAVANLESKVKENGEIFISLYNEQINILELPADAIHENTEFVFSNYPSAKSPLIIKVVDAGSDWEVPQLDQFLGVSPINLIFDLSDLEGVQLQGNNLLPGLIYTTGISKGTLRDIDQAVDQGYLSAILEQEWLIKEPSNKPEVVIDPSVLAQIPGYGIPTENVQAATCSCPDNLLDNHSFENGTADWGSSGNFFTGNYYVVCGSKSGLLKVENGVDVHIWQEVDANFAAGDEIDLTFWGGVHNPSYDHWVRLAYYNANWGLISDVKKQINQDLDNGGMAQYTINSTVPSGTAHVRVEAFSDQDWLKIDMFCFNWVSVSCDPNNPNAPPFCAPDPICNGSDTYLWEQTIDQNSGQPSEVRFICNNVEQYVIPGPYPSDFNGPVTIHVTDAVSWDGYTNRINVSQPNEQWRVVFKKNGQTVYATPYTQDVPDYVKQGNWRGSLGVATYMPNGVDQIILEHYDYEASNCPTGPNSVVPTSICLTYETCNNVTDGGEIAENQEGCGPSYDPETITNEESPSGGSGNMEIIWIKSTTNCPPEPFDWDDWDIIPGATGLSYNPPPITETTCYRRCARRQGCEEYDGESNIVTVTVNPGLNLSTSVTHVDCNGGNDGHINLTVSGGDGSYSYEWSNGATTQDLNNVSAGTYTVTVTSGDCSKTTSATVNQPPALSLSTSVTHIDCYGESTGAINLSVSGGTPGYTYEWSNGATTQDISNVPAGTYTVTVTDSEDCTKTKTKTINEPSELDLSATVTHIDCDDDDDDGAINLHVSGGESPYSYDWSNGATTQDLDHITAGTYTVTVTDDNDCTAVLTKTVTQVESPELSATVTNVSCYNGSDGEIDLHVSGGNPPYEYDWSNGATTQDLSGVSAGTYTVTVTDEDGCTAVLTKIVEEPSQINRSATVTNVKCYGESTGKINLTVSGGTTPYSYNWSNGATTQDLNNIPAGTYTVTITDANDCTKTLSKLVKQPQGPLSLSVDVDDATCGYSNGDVNLHVSGGTPGYSYDWSNGATSQDLNNVSAGTYTVTVTDSKNCTKTIMATVQNIGGPMLSAVVTHIECYGDNTGAINLSVSGGASPYEYDWSNGATTQDLNNLSAGTYTVTVTDDNDCTAVLTKTVNQPSQIQRSANVTHVDCYGESTGGINLSVSGGTPPYSYDWSNGATTQDLNNIPAGTYTVTITDDNDCTKTLTKTVNQPPSALSLSVDVEDATCGNSNGDVDLHVSGGTPGYTYDWSNGATTQDLNNVSAGTYTVTVTDDNDCTKTITATVQNLGGPMLSAVVTHIECYGEHTGAINLTVNGGASPYEYDWSNGATTQDLNNLGAGTYTVTVTDDNDCTAVLTKTVNQPSEIQRSATVTHVKCYGESTGKINLSVNGGTPPYSYDWSNGATTQDLNNVPAGTYTVTITDDNDCTKTLTKTVNQPPSALNLSVDVEDATCGYSNGDVDLHVSGGTPGYSYDWSNGATTQDLNNVSAGTYTVTVTDNNNCTKTITATVDNVGGPMLSATVSNVTCNGYADGSIDLTVSNGTPPYSYNWSNGATTQDITGLSGGTYTVTVTDDNDCTAVISKTVNEPPALSLSATVSHVTCNGYSDGSINLSVSGGTPGYTYLWSNGATTMDLNNVSAGTYTVTVTDANNCTKSLSKTINQPPALNLSATAENTTCQNGSDGSIDLTVSGGTPGYTYLWSNGATTQDINGLSAGTYTVTVTDANNCTSSISKTVNQPAGLNLSTTAMNVSCHGGNDGTIDLTVMGGTPGYTYDWSNGSASEDLFNLTAGTYTVTVTDINGCTAVTSQVVTEPPAIVVTASVDDVTCFGYSDGAITLTVSGGTPGYTYFWSNGETTKDVSGLTAGTYSVTVSDANNCTKVVTKTVNQPPALNLSATVNNVTCNGYSNGSINLTVMGGTPGYTYLWSNGATTMDLNNVSAGTYTVTVTDANDCTKTLSKTINEPPAINLSATVNDVTCNGYSDGSIDLTVNGGTPGYTYLWSNGATSQDLNNISAGTYTVTVTDANNCTKSLTKTVGQPPLLSLSATVTNVSCNGYSDGAIDLTVSGGTPGYTYLWSNGATTMDINNVTAGTYTVTVTDANNCTASLTKTVTEPPVLMVDATVNHVTCNGFTNGSIDLIVVGGTPGYTYLWSNGFTGQDPSGLGAGTYTVTVTDANNCTATLTKTVNEPPAIQLNATVVDVTCFGFANGEIYLGVSGGTPGYTYLWSNGSTIEDISGLVAGTYTVTVTDANNCTATLSRTVNQPPALNASATVENVTCNGYSDGSIDLSVSGGNPPYIYEWSNGDNTQDISGLVAGTYTVTITDDNDCTLTLTKTVTEPPVLLLSATVDDVKCNGGSDGSINLTVSGGTPGYTYLWSNGFTGQDPSGLSAGTYTVTVTDANNCTSSLTKTVNEPPALNLSATAEDATCNGGADGSIDLTVTGGTPGYTYLWSNGFTGQDPSGLSAGTYTVTVTDANNCTATLSKTVGQPTPLNLSADVNNVLCFGGSDGSIDLTVTGGTPGYTYNWSNGFTGQDPSGLSAGTYTVTVTDANNCTATISKTVGQPPLLVLTAIPSNVKCNGGSDGSINLTVVGGTPGYTYNWSNGFMGEDPSGLPIGTYTVTVTDANNCTATTSATIQQPPALNLSATTVDVSCNGGSDGSINLTVTGGTPGYTYLWSNGFTGQDPSGLSAGTYTVTVTDANNCTATLSRTINEPPALMITGVMSPVSCFGGNDGWIDITVTGGTPAYSYNWSNGFTGEDPSNLSAGTYVVTVTDANNCTETYSIMVTQPPLLVLSTVVDDVDCFGGSDGSIDLTVTGGTPGYTYNWSNGFTGQDPSGLSAGTYTVTVTDANGCTMVTSATVMQPTDIVLSVEVEDVLCNGGSDGSIDLTVSGGTPGYTYLWSNGFTGQDPSGLTAGTYTVTVTDAHGCTDVISGTVNEPPALQLSTSMSPVLCNGGSDGSIDLTVVGGTPGYTYMWSNGFTGQDPNGLTAGTYTVTVTDSHGCTAVTSETVTEPPALDLNVDVENVSCFGGSDGSINLTVNGGTPGYNYLWSNGATTQDISGLSIGTYTVTVTDANNCTAVISGTVTQPPLLTASTTVNNVSCNGGSDGSINLTVNGGTPGYTYNWSNGFTGQDPSGLTAGTYTVTVTDANGCTVVTSATVTEPPLLVVSVTVEDVSCFNGSDGSIDLTVSGGTPGYTYLWSNGFTGQDPSGLSAGTYTVTVTDANDCTAVISGTVNQPTDLVLSVDVSDAVCFGSADGSIDLTVSGGTPGYTYNWSNGETTQDISGLTTGTYTVTVTDANNCTKVISGFVDQPPLMTLNSSVVPVSSCGLSDGSITIDVTNGVPGYSYEWEGSTGNTGNGFSATEPFTIANLPFGVYTVTVTNADGCTATITETVPQPSSMYVTSYTLPTTTCSSNDGKIVIEVFGGTPNYAYTWEDQDGNMGNGANIPNNPFEIAGLPPGSYSVTVTSGNGCIGTTFAVVESPSEITLTSSNTPVTCEGDDDGTITIDVDGGSPDYTYNWTNGVINGNGVSSNEPFTITGLGGGNWTVTVSDGNSCTGVITVFIDEPPAINLSATWNNATCGVNNGSIDLTVSGGNPPYTFLWSNGFTGEDPFGLSAGTYCVTVTDDNDCTATTCVTVNAENGPVANTVVTDVNCAGDSNGAVDLTVSGGVSPYTYNWSNGANTEDLNNIPGGTYTVTVTDANGCSVVKVAVVNEPPALELDVDVTDASCGDNNGSIDLTVSGGTPGYTYNWSNGFNGEDPGNLFAGTYTVTVTDANGCTEVISATVNDAGAPSLSTQVTNVTCFGGNDGAVDLTVTGGTPNYTYNWSNGATTQDIDNVGAGTYTVTVTDANNCSAVTTVLVTQPPALNLSTVVTNTTCGLSNGAIDLTVNGGTPGYTYNWSNGETTQDIGGLSAGTYTVTVTDANNCTETASVTVLPSNSPMLSTSVTDATCGDDNGAIDLTVSGGTAPYTYLWDNGATTEDINNLTAGTYCVTVTDAEGCTAVACDNVGNVGGPMLTTVVTDANCGLANGAVDLTVSGGAAPYSYMWDNGATTEDLDNVIAGTYCVTVTDANDCSAVVCAEVEDTGGLILTVDVENATCNEENGSIDLTVTGCPGPYTYSWSNGETTEDLVNIPPGTYTVTVTATNSGLTATTSATVNNIGNNPTANAVPTNTTCGQANGSVDLTVNGGQAPYTYMWDNGATTEDISNLTSGTYCVTVTDANGCTTTTCATVEDEDGPEVTVTSVTNTNCGASNGAIDITVTGGAAPYSFMWDNGATTEDISNLAAGTYCVTVTDANDCTGTACATVEDSNSPDANTVATDAACGQANGSVDLTVTGGQTPYSYMWSNGATTEDINNLVAGTYCVTVTDANGCTATSCATVNNADGPNVSVSSVSNELCGSSNGSIDITVTGGAQPYTYLWDNGATTEDINNLEAGTYCVTVTDANGCTGTACATVESIDGPELETEVTDSNCELNNGSIDLTVIGGAGPYTYIWSNGATTEDIDNLEPGIYCATVTDDNGCTATICDTVETTPIPNLIDAVVINVSGGANNGSIDITVTGGTPPYSYMWSNGATTEDIDNLEPGIYCVTIVDSNDCQADPDTCFEITGDCNLAITAASTGTNCGNSNGGIITVIVTGGTLPFSYEWTNGNQSGSDTGVTDNQFEITGLSAGTYTITVTDEQGCTGVVTQSVQGGDIGGMAFDDPNSDGEMDPDNEFGLENIKVYIYECDNPVPVDSTLTDEDGNFTFSGLNNYPYRIEFSNELVPWMKPSYHGNDNGTTVQFIDSLDCNIKVSYFNPDDYCQDKPNVIFSSFGQGTAELSTNPALAMFPYDGQSPEDVFAETPSTELGSVYGLAYDRERKQVFAAAFVKRHSGLGVLGEGGIYRIDYHDETAVVSPLYIVPNAGTVVRPQGDLAGPQDQNLDADAFEKVGKVGLGDLDISSDFNTLWTVNLNTQNLVRIDSIRTNPVSVEIPIASAPNCDNGVFRPFGLKVHRGRVYVGGVCTGEFDGTADDLYASIHEYNPATDEWTNMMSTKLTGPEYDHGDVVGSVNPNLGQCREWEIWTDEYTERNLVPNTGAGEPNQIFDGNFEIVGGGPTGAEFRCRAQAMVSDIEFTREGLVVVGMMDRTGHQFGYRQFRPTTDQGTPISAANGGDIIVAYQAESGWVLEKNGSIPIINRDSWFGAGTYQGPAGGEFFYDNTRSYHLDADAGGLVHIPSAEEVLSVVVNPNTSEYTFGGGVAYYSLMNGSSTRNDLTIVDPTLDNVMLGKANPIGDLEAICDDAPIQLGNRVWADCDADGVQDACEDPLEGVLVSLYDAVTGQLLATTETDAIGEYYFTGIGTPGENWISTPGFDSIQPHTQYKIVFGTDGTTNQFNTSTGNLELNGLFYPLTIANTGEGLQPDNNDSDALIAVASGMPWNGFPTIMYTTGMAGCTDHTLDAGFLCNPAIIIYACEKKPNTGWFTLTDADILVDPDGIYEVSYHISEANAQAGIQPLPTPYLGVNGYSVWARLFDPNTGDVELVEVILQTLPKPKAIASNLKVCPDVFSGMMGTFILHDADADVTGGIVGLTVSYHLSEDDAIAGAFALPDTFTSGTLTIWTRVVNGQGCYDVDLLQLVVLPSPAVVLFAEDNTCTGSNDGSVTAQVVAGPAEYTYDWSNGVTEGPTHLMASSIDDLSAGIYTVTVTDGNGCTAEKSAEVEDGMPFFLLPIDDLVADNGEVVGPISLATNLWGAQFEWTGGAGVGLVDGNASSINPLIPPFTAQGPASATVVVTATLGLCSDTDTFEIDVNGVSLSLSGTIFTTNDQPVVGADVELIGQHPVLGNISMNTETAAEGWYGFIGEIPENTDLTIVPHKDDDPLNGVTVADLKLLENYLNGAPVLPTPYLMIAADLDKSGGITFKDLNHLQALLLGLESKLKSNTSWRFIDKDFVFADPANPFAEPFPETITVENMDVDRFEDDFLGIKIGDLNNSAVSLSLANPEDRLGGLLLFNTVDRNVTEGEAFELTFSADRKVAGYQFTLELEGLELIELLPGDGMNEGNFAIFDQALTTTYLGNQPGNFTIRVRAKQDGRISDLVRISSRITKAVMYTEDADGLLKGSVDLRFNSEISSDAFALFQNTPNPFANQTVIGFYLPEAAKATLSIHDESGRLIYTMKGEYAKGYNTIALDRSQVPAGGVLFYTLVTGEDSATRMMIVSDK